MLQNTFLHIPGVGYTTEQALWSRGMRCWGDLEKATSIGLPRGTLERLYRFIPRSAIALATRDISFFARLSRLGEAWRVYKDFSDRCVYIDIETTGLSPIFNNITLVGLYDGSEYRVYVEGQNLHELPDALRHYDIAVTFNGSQFDLRFLRAAFDNLVLPPIHIDLRWLTRRLGYTGGLKAIEAQLGLKRPTAIADINGFDATILWSRYLRGDANAFDLLIQYNLQDVVNLKTIMECAYERLAVSTGAEQHRRKRSRALNSHLPSLSNRVSPSARETPQVDIVSDLLLEARKLGRGTRIVGIDLTGSERRASGWALLDGRDVRTTLIKTDLELIARTLEVKPDVVSIDSPLSLPGGRHSPQECKQAGLPIYRACELALKRMGISVFWCLLPSMIDLTLRGIKLAAILRRAGVTVIESYPGAAQDLLRIPRKGASLQELKWGLIGAGVAGSYAETRTSHDEIDAITSALVGLFYAANKHIAVGNRLEDYLMLPHSPKINMHRFGAILEQSGLDSLPEAHKIEPIRCA